MTVPSTPTPLATARSFVARINAHDLEGLASLMSADHRFVDSLGAVFEGRETMRATWTQYFALVPDYALDVEDSFDRGDVVILLGRARGTCKLGDRPLDPADAWSTPAAWRALVREGLVCEWQVFADNEPLRRRLAARDR